MSPPAFPSHHSSCPFVPIFQPCFIPPRLSSWKFSFLLCFPSGSARPLLWRTHSRSNPFPSFSVSLLFDFSPPPQTAYPPRSPSALFFFSRRTPLPLPSWLPLWCSVPVFQGWNFFLAEVIEPSPETALFFFPVGSPPSFLNLSRPFPLPSAPPQSFLLSRKTKPRHCC